MDKAASHSSTFEENFLKREKKRKLETQREIERMRAELPKYNLNDIRQFKLPYHEALLLQLEESGYENTDKYIKFMFELQEQLRNNAGPHSNMWNRPLLKHSEVELRKLSEALIKAEDCHNTCNYNAETEILLITAIDFCFNTNDWFWLGEQVLLKGLNNAVTYQNTGKHESLARYIYAKLLIEKVMDYENAEVHLNISRKFCAGKSWNIKQFFPELTDSTTLFMNANYLLHICYMRQARHWAKIDLRRAIEFAVLAKKRANEACYHDGETEALLLKGQCEINTSDLKSAINTFNKAYYIQSKIKSEVGMCQARVELSKAYLMYGNTNLALKHLLHLKEMAKLHNLTFYLAQAYRYLGEFYLNNGEPGKATPLLADALDIFYQGGAIAQADQVRKLEALSSGLELMPQYIELIRQTGRECDKWFENLIKLVKWKDLREPFYEKKEDLGSSLFPKILSELSHEQGKEVEEEIVILDANDDLEMKESSVLLPESDGANAEEVETKYVAYE